MSASKLFLTVLATVGWLLATALVFRPVPPPSEPAKAAVPTPVLARQILHDQQLQSVIEDTRDQLIRRHPDKALENVSYAFSLCRARDQQPPAEVYQLFAEAYCQSMTTRDTPRTVAVPTAAAKRPSNKVSSTSTPVVTSRKILPPAPELFSQDEPRLSSAPAKPGRRPDFSMPGPDYPTAPPGTARQPASPQDPPEDPGGYRLPAPAPEVGHSDRPTPPPIPHGMRQPPHFPGPPAGGPPGVPSEGRRGRRPGPIGDNSQLPYPSYPPSGSGGSPPGY